MKYVQLPVLRQDRVNPGERGIGLARSPTGERPWGKTTTAPKAARHHLHRRRQGDRGGRRNAPPIVGDVRDGDSVAAAVAKTVQEFGGIDMCVNNASAINLGRSRRCCPNASIS